MMELSQTRSVVSPQARIAARNQQSRKLLIALGLLLLALVAGFGSQHNANEPDTAFAESPLIALLDPALDMYAAYFSPTRPAGWTPWADAGR